MRRLAAALLATTLLLAGCSSTEEPDPSTEAEVEVPDGGSTATPEDLAALEAVTVVGDIGSEPTLEFEQPFTVVNAVALVETPGTGEPLEDGQALSVHSVTYSGEDGSLLDSSWERSPDSITFGDPQIYVALTEALAGQSIGSRLLFATPAIEESDLAAATPSMIMAIDVVDARTVPTRAEGEAVEPPAGLPEVTLAEDGAPTIEIPEGYEAPAELVVQTLIEGPGAAVEAGQTVTFQYTGVQLSDGSVFDSSWESGAPFSSMLGVGQVISGWDEGLVGQTIGSQVLLVIPPDMAYGGSEHALAEETLVFVVDILDAA